MTSSYKLKKRFKHPEKYDFGHQFDHYIRPFGKCHPDFDTILIGDDPRGVKICKRRASPEPKKKESLNYPLLYRYSRQMYNFDRLPLVRMNTTPRIPPNEAYNIINDFYKLDHFFNGTGLYKGKTCNNISEYALSG